MSIPQPIPHRITAGFLDHRATPLGGGTITAPSATMSVFEGGNPSTRRGYVYAPTLDTRAELPPSSRQEILRRCRYLTRNVGFAKRCISGLARMAGWQSPVPLTQDKPWNKLAADLFERRYGAAALGFDVQARWNFYSYQTLATATRLQDGDFFTALTESANGQAMVMSYEAHQVGNGNRTSTDGFIDGVRVNKFLRPLGYNILNSDGTSQVLDAKDLIQHADFASVGHVRSPSALAHAVTHLLDRTELLSDLKLSTKISVKDGLYIVNQLPQTRTTAPPGMSVATGQPTTGTPAAWSQQDLFAPGKPGGKIVELQPGQELKNLLDQRPHPNTLEFLDYLCRDIAAGLDMAPEVLWNIAKLGGASVRYVMADAQKTVERLQQILVDQFLTRFWVYFVAKEIAAGRLPPCADPNWYLVGWQAPAKLTVDIGREGRLSIDLHKTGLLTLAGWYGMQGKAWQDEVDQSIEEYAYRVKACAARQALEGFPITPSLVWPALIPAPTAPAILDPDPALDDANITQVAA